MKKIYTLIVLLMYLSLVSAQDPLSYPKELEKECSYIPNHIHQQQENLKSGLTIWSEDFANGMPAGWTIQDLSGICPWVWSNDGSWGYYNGNNATAAGTTMNSSSANNGFLICDADSANHFNALANGGQGGPNSGTEYQYLESYFTTSAIDLTGHPAVVLEFQQYFRFNNSIDMNVMISTNNVTWTTYTVQGNSVNNTYSDDPDTVKINISAVAGNQPTVYIKIGWSARVYFWQIDDIKITEAEPNDLALKSHFFETLGLPYYQIPVDQITDINFSALITNNGANNQQNSKLSVDINSSNIGSSNPTTINSGNTDSLFLSTGYILPSSTGQYDLKWSAVSDSTDDTPSDNYKTESIMVTDYIYARDNDDRDGNRWNSGYAYEVGNYFDIVNTADLYGLDFVVDDASNPGSVVYGALYSIDANGDFIYVSGTDDYILTASDVSNESTITLPLFTAINLTGNKGYLMMIGAYGDGGVTNDLVVRTAGVSAPQTSFKYDGTDLTWYYTTKTPMVRMNFDPSIASGSTIENNLSMILDQNVPNPFNESSIINITVQNSSIANFEVTDITGKTIYNTYLGYLNKGVHQVKIESENLSPGIYFYSLIFNNQKLTKKMIVKN